MVDRLKLILEMLWDGGDAVRDAGRDLDALERKTKQMGDGSQKSSFSVGKLGLALGAAGAAAGATVVAFDRVWAAMKEGAALDLARRQFDALSASIGTTGRALEQDLAAAAGGLVPTAKLVADASAIMNQKLARSHDGVVRLAAVAGKLNWDMQVLGLTIANQSTMRLDSLGLAIEDVIPRVNALKASGMAAQEAFLFAVLEAGEAKVRLFGDTSDTTAAKIARMETAWANFVDRLKVGAANVGGVVLDVVERAAREQRVVREALAQGIVDQEGYTALFSELGAEGAVDHLERRLQMRAVTDAERAEVLRYGELLANIRREAHLPVVSPRQQRAILNYGENLRFLERAGREAATAQRALAEAQEAAAEAAAQASAAARSKAEAGYFSQILDDADPTRRAIVDVNAELYNQIRAAGANAETLAFAGVALGQFSEAQARAALKTAAMRARIEELGRAVADGMRVDEALAQFDAFVRGLAQAETQTARNETRAREYAQAVNAIAEEKVTRLVLEDDRAVSALADFRRRLDELPDVKTVHLNVEGQMPSARRPGGEQAPWDADVPGRAIGGLIYPGQAVPVGERGPELFFPRQTGYVVPNSQLDAFLGGGVTINVQVQVGDPGAEFVPAVRDGVLEALQQIRG